MTHTATTPTMDLATVDARTIEHELAQLWHVAAESENAGGAAMMRACVLNLVVLTTGTTVDRATALIARLTAACPNRAIVAAMHATDASLATPASGRLDAWVQAHCHLPAPGRPQVCGEQITIVARQGGEAQIPGVVLALLEPDVPVVLWWAFDHLPEGELLAQLRSVADRLVLDTTHMGGAGAALAAAHAFATEGVAVSDLAWGRLTPWREQIAQLFDAPPALQRLPQIERVIIEQTPAGTAAALLLAGWLGTRLDWRPDAPVDDAVPLRRKDGGTTWLEILPVESAAVDGIVSVALFVPDAQFIVFRGTMPGHLTACAIVDGLAPVERAVRLPEQDDAALIIDELRLARRDPIYEAALRQANELYSRVRP